MIALFQYLALKNNFHFESDPHFWPGQEYLLNKFTNMSQNTVYINHCKYVELQNEASFDDIVWINMVREPIERQESLYYYGVSPKRGIKAQVELQSRDRNVDPCGCMNMEFDDCYRFYLENTNCTHRLKVEPLELYFADSPVRNTEPRPFPQDMIYDRIRNDYLFVGILEEWELSVQAFEVLLPRFFKGATAYFKSRPHHHNVTPEVNKLTNTTKSGAISTHVREALKHYNREEIVLYERIKRLFWMKIASLFPDLASKEP